MRAKRAIAIPIVLMALSVLVVIVTAVCSAGLSTLFLTGIEYDSKQSLYAAEAGVAQAVREIIAGTSGWNGYTDVPYQKDCTFSVEVMRGPRTGPGGPTVPAGCAYLLSTGLTRGKYPRRVGVLITTGPAGGQASFPYAVAAAQTIEMQGGGHVSGSLKSSESLDLGGGIRILTSNGEGRLLAGQNIDLGGGVKRDDSQDIRARGYINGYTTPDPASQFFPSDSTPASLPFIADGRFTNTLATGESGEVLPNPDPTRLLGLTSDGAGGYLIDAVTGLYTVDPARTDVVQHPETSVSGTLLLGGKIHFFPKGVDFQGDIQGEGTIVSGEGHDLHFKHIGSNSSPLKMNALALSWPKDPRKGEIYFESPSHLQGLVLAHGGVHTQGNFSLKGVLIAYAGGVRSQGHRLIDYDGSGFALPGLESWRVAPSGPPGPGTQTGIPSGQPIQVITWQRL